MYPNLEIKDAYIVVARQRMIKDELEISKIQKAIDITKLGIEKMIISSDCADIYSQKVVRASMGAIFKLDIYVVDDLIETVENIKAGGRRVIATALNDKALVLGKDRISADDVIILGNEGHGMSQKLIDSCTDVLFIPMNENNTHWN